MVVRPHIAGALAGPGMWLFGALQLSRCFEQAETVGMLLFGSLAVMSFVGGWIAFRVTWIEVTDEGIRLRFPRQVIAWRDVTRVACDSEVIVFHTKSDSFVLARRAFWAKPLQARIESGLIAAANPDDKAPK